MQYGRWEKRRDGREIKVGAACVCAFTLARWEWDESRTSGKAGLVQAVRREGRGSGGLRMTMLVSPNQPSMNKRYVPM